ncbi:hypothetical protein [Actinomadura sp. 7K507]|uniref:LppU/SCO3897 family protein n=1 Tax=Actinomadura sp. 7K507 TaxID=2530365 RepID=UPI001053BA92|nr:hypothetical protein [Actinomadura sp. 7K507]TDC75258.1 hypothetical protein E1285_41680 [Actinomadura sp. 7K507]
MYGQAPGGQPPPPIPPLGAPAPPRAKRPSPVVLAVAGLAAVLVIAVAGFAMFQAAGDRLTGPLQAEQCIDTTFGMDTGNKIPASKRVECDAPEAKATVLKVTDEGEATGFQFGTRSEPDCPDGTDGITNVTVETGSKRYYEACVRNIKGPHPGDPGAGGALLSVGDCVSGGSLGIGGKEEPCSGSEWYGKVIARVDSERSCPAKTLETMKMRSFAGGEVARPVLCLGAGGGVLATGDCIGDPSFNIGSLPKADCGTGKAVAKVVGRVKSKQECPAEGTHFMTSDGGYLPVLCLKKLRPTLTEKLRSLGS